jgi:hypothetical protein
MLVSLNSERKQRCDFTAADFTVYYCTNNHYFYFIYVQNNY